jgi:predicted AlkP superfamily phosphohydrolase/phosphomutase
MTIAVRVFIACFVALVCGCSKKEAPAGPNQQPLQGAQDHDGKDAKPAKGRLIMLGFDGVDPRWLEQWAKEGKLPALKQLMEENAGKGYLHLGSTNPPQSPVAWTSFATGTQPGDHGIFDFIARTVNTSPTGLPVSLRVATTTFEVQPAGPPVARNLRTGTPFWQTLGNDGVRVVALNVPYSFPPNPMRDGRMLSGLGVPDLRETNSTFTYVGTDVTDDRVKRPPGGGVMVKLAMQKGLGHFDLEGPSVPGGDGERMKIPVEVQAGDAGGMKVVIAGKTYALKIGEWSDFVELAFSHEGTRVAGIAKLLALEVGKQTRLFVSPLSFHPRDPYSAISHPRSFSGKIADDLGHLYKTVGWDHDTSALNAEVIDDGQYLADMESIEKDRTKMLLDRLNQPDWDLLIWVSTATDRAAHMFYRLIDPQHPRYDAALAKRYGDAIEREYRRMDATVAQVRKQLGKDDTLLILSDHGFHNYRRGLHVNQWLRQQGLLALRGNAASSGREFLIDVDWSKTKAYAVGTGQVYFNLQGREREGIVPADQAAALAQQIKTGLLGLRDKERGDAIAVKNVYAGADVFKGGRADSAPDLQIAFAENYRTSWETILGGVPAALFADNDKKWSGDHAASDVADTPGILIANRPLGRTAANIADLAPTACAFFSKSVPAEYTGKSVF